METVPSPEIGFPDQKTVRSAASRCAFSVILYYIFGNLLAAPLLVAVMYLPNGSLDSVWLSNLELLLSSVIGVIAVLIAWAILLRSMPKAEAPEASVPLSIRRLAFYLPCTIAVMLAGGLITAIPKLFGVKTYDVGTQSALAEASLWAKVLSAVLLAPVTEELFFRKLMLDRLSGFHPTTAILYTALLFGLTHGNFSQFISAFLGGVLLGIIYFRTQNILYPILLHASVNTIAVFSGLIGGAAGEWIGNGILLLLVLFGVFLLIRYRKRFLPIPSGHPRYGKAFFVNVGWIVFCILFVLLIVFREAGSILRR